MANFLSELEIMAVNARTADRSEEIQQVDIHRWQKLFELSAQEAHKQIVQYRNDIGRSRVSEDLWDLVREEKEALGFDRESYEFSLYHAKARKATASFAPTNQQQRQTVYVLKLEVPLDTAEKVQAAASLLAPPEVTEGTGETGNATFCTVDGCTRRKIIDWIALHYPNFRPTIVRLSKSPKNLGSISIAPALGIEGTMLPHKRAEHADFVPMPTQDQYPVWYFFYGNLARPEELQQRLGLKTPPVYVPARVRGGKIMSWRGQYRALVDAEHDVLTYGSAFLVVSREHEDSLRFYETEKYEVVRCEIEMDGRVEKGLVFRFAGSADELG